jgi:hypothetical protein
LVYEGNLQEISYGRGYVKQNWHVQIKNFTKYKENLPKVLEYSVCANAAGEVHAIFIGEDGHIYDMFFTKQRFNSHKWDFRKILFPLMAGNILF